jgi:hypothetical protein
MLNGMARPRNLAALTGRPSKFTLEAAAEVLQRMSDGEPLYRICQDEHLPSPATIRNWASDPRRSWFGAAFKEAQRSQAHLWFEQTVQIADDLENASAVHEVYAAQTRIRARQWACSRLNPEAYGDKPVGPSGHGARVVIYLPGLETDPETGLTRKRMGSYDNVIEGTARQVEDGREDE